MNIRFPCLHISLQCLTAAPTTSAPRTPCTGLLLPYVNSSPPSSTFGMPCSFFFSSQLTFKILPTPKSCLKCHLIGSFSMSSTPFHITFILHGGLEPGLKARSPGLLLCFSTSCCCLFGQQRTNGIEHLLCQAQGTDGWSRWTWPCPQGAYSLADELRALVTVLLSRVLGGGDRCPRPSPLSSALVW